MKKLVILVLLFLLAVLTAGSVYAQGMIKADIPFAFTVGGKTLLPGAYNAEQRWGSPVVCLQGTENSFAIALTHKVEGEPNQNVEPKFVFRRYGDQYFLAQVWVGRVDLIGREIPKSSKERQVARSTFEPELIFIAAK